MSNADRICIVCNTGSGRTDLKDRQIEAAMNVLGDRATLRRIRGEEVAATARTALADGYGAIVAAGGDGTLMTVAGVVAGTGARFGVLPLGTFNHFAKGHDIPLDPEAAARVLLDGHTRRIPLGEVNGHLFLNNMSIGIYPAILRTREDVYKRWGRRRLGANWSVVKTFVRFQRPLHLTLTAEGRSWKVTTPLLFAAVSSYQLESFDLAGTGCLAEGRIPVFVAPETGRAGLLLEAFRLVRGAMKEGRDFDLTCTAEMTIAGRSRHLTVACDGEKFRMRTPLRLTMRPDAIEVLAPPAAEADPVAPEPAAAAA